MSSSTRFGPSRLVHRFTKYGFMAGMPTPAMKYTCPSTLNASTLSPTTKSIAQPSICVSKTPTIAPLLHGQCLPTIPMFAHPVPPTTTIPSTTISTVRVGTTATTRTCTTTPTTAVSPAIPLPCTPSPIILARSAPATPNTPTAATPPPTCHW